MFNRILLPFRLFLFGLKNNALFGETMFIVMSKLLEYVLKVSLEDKPFSTNLMLGEGRIVSLWAYPGVGKNPVDRIHELLKEIDSLKELANTRRAK